MHNIDWLADFLYADIYYKHFSVPKLTNASLKRRKLSGADVLAALLDSSTDEGIKSEDKHKQSVDLSDVSEDESEDECEEFCELL